MDKKLAKNEMTLGSYRTGERLLVVFLRDWFRINGFSSNHGARTSCVLMTFTDWKLSGIANIEEGWTIIHEKSDDHVD